ncbi:ecotropic viral integration site 5 ortholog isoform X1 [Microplitis mediator]|uniref:ecotropic viral integration site 5 ortholog isoform X1 n=1 Tax=Microplitis mediator TaxID=375433 RepID=UPI002552AB4E|nr:ecotropic viral integration site 5 ortholog isoform X1 [Microplitis mediator]XP_057326263.1 ecotropic viral integration site 5 ortholog isoform X1 [Microplitis mediator]
MSINLINNLSIKSNWKFGLKAIIILSAFELDLNFKKVSSDNKIISTDELALLGKLEEANRLIESDVKSCNSLQSNHSRKSSESFQATPASGSSGEDETAARRHTPTDGEVDVWKRWGHIVADWENYWRKHKDVIKELVKQGIPHHFRGIVWQLLCGAHDSPVKKQFAEYIKSTSACERIIRRDIARTYPEHEFFKEKDGLGQESLFNVMKAYSLHDREVGYCQGSGFIVGLLLMQQMPEEEAFAVLVALMQEYRLRDMFKPSMAELGVCMYQLEHLVTDTYPELSAHFTAQSFHTSMYASSWFLTLFTTALSLPLACRIFDVFLMEGMDIIFKVALAMLDLGKDDLLSLDMEGMLKFFQKELPGRAENDPDGLLNLAYGMKINPKRMKKLEKDYTVLKMKEQEEMVELRRLRAENRLLRQRTELLEAESAELADRLVRGQVSRAEEEETTFVVQRELAALRHTHLETSHQLEQAHEELRSLSMLLEENMSSKQSSIDEMSMKQEALSQKEEMVECLQQELVRVRLHEAEKDATIRDLRGRIQELEQDKKTLRESTPDNSVAHLQEELIAVKLREAEANLSLKDLRQRVGELSTAWQRHLQEHRSAQSAPAADSTPKKLLFWENRGHEIQKLEEDLMSTRVREMVVLSEVKELRLKVMELETQVQVATNQLRRQDEGEKLIREELEISLAKIKELTSKLREQMHKYSDLESKMKDDAMMARIRDAEHAQHVAELTQKISLLELKNEEMYAEGELRSNLDDSDRVRDLQDKVAELKAEIMRLKNSKYQWTGSTEQIGRNTSIDTDSEFDERDLRICLQDQLNNITISDSPRN